MTTYRLSPDRAQQPHISRHVSGPGLGRVLVVETYATTAEMALMVLSAAGYDAMRSTSAQQAVAAAQWWRPDLVLLDLILPDLPGVQACRLLHDQSPAPIMIMSTETDPEVISAAIAVGACEYLPKPFRTGELLTRIHSRLHD
ncbi:response regulator [Nocardia sp. BMG51109]|uniref:response regulator n=1 Tax=Nocardia sp. BMG51109 TaxID=1056816 RepID=UPI0004B8D5CD|nr:response regulator [Nocardia sp. BMG51109]